MFSAVLSDNLWNHHNLHVCPKLFSKLNYILQVVDPKQLASHIQADADQIDAPLGLLQAVGLKVVLRGGDQAPGLGGGDRLFRSAERGAPAGTDLDKNEFFTVAGHDINLAPPAAVVGGLHRVAFALQIPAGVPFSPLSQTAPRRGQVQEPPENRIRAWATGANDRRWMGQGPSSFSRSKWTLVG